MLHVLDVRDAMDSERFQQVQFDPVNDPKNLTHNNSALTVGGALTADTASKEECEKLIIFAEVKRFKLR